MIFHEGIAPSTGPHCSAVHLSFDAPWSRQILDHRSWSRSPQRNAPSRTTCVILWVGESVKHYAYAGHMGEAESGPVVRHNIHTLYPSFHPPSSELLPFCILHITKHCTNRKLIFFFLPVPTAFIIDMRSPLCLKYSCLRLNPHSPCPIFSLHTPFGPTVVLVLFSLLIDHLGELSCYTVIYSTSLLHFLSIYNGGSRPSAKEGAWL